MKKAFKRRPSPAMFVALAALFIALGGAAYAVTKAPKNSVVSRSIKNSQVKPKDLNKASKAAWIYVEDNAKVNGTPGVSVNDLAGEGLYFVRFPFSVRNRAIIAQATGDDADNLVYARRCGNLPGDNVNCSPAINDTPRTVFVETVDNDSDIEIQDGNFWLAAIP